jgi:hypothetical protein
MNHQKSRIKVKMKRNPLQARISMSLQKNYNSKTMKSLIRN